MKHGSPYGMHRVLEPLGVLPQPAWKLDNTMAIYDNEILIDVSALNIDSASFTQIKAVCENDEARIAAHVQGIV
ncbi:MAG: L-erythro-3,5-diaminohexanoate dehydrogenase, partial [Betaproteobacteria bacterium]|nr:L-erythro-3,5-diaminohexanoate dehydrogenase [Betaproteobacteria bacterium]